jgi:hypothetical protein
MQTKLVKKISPTETLYRMNVGETAFFRDSDVRYTTVYPSVKRIEKKTSMRFAVTIKDVVGGTKVTRLA